jgi:transcription elongation factor GreB
VVRARELITQEGWQRLSDEAERLLRVERPATVQVVANAAAEGDRSENAEYIYGKKRLREIDSRIRYLQGRLERLRVEPPPTSVEQVRFLSRVEVENVDTAERVSYTLVGPDESDPARGLLSYLSPLGRALMGKRLGDDVEFEAPSGTKFYELLRIELPRAEPSTEEGS